MATAAGVTAMVSAALQRPKRKRSSYQSSYYIRVTKPKREAARAAASAAEAAAAAVPAVHAVPVAHATPMAVAVQSAAAAVNAGVVAAVQIVANHLR